MPEPTGVATAQGAQPAQPQGGTAPAQGAEAPSGQGPGAAEGGSDVAALNAKIAELERDNRKYRDDMKRRDQEADKASRASLSEAEQTARRLEELERQNAELARSQSESRLRAAVTEAAVKLGFRNPEVAFKLIDREAVVEQDGAYRNVDRLLRDVLAAEPYLGRSQQPDYGGGSRGGTPQGSDMNTIIRRAAGRQV